MEYTALGNTEYLGKASYFDDAACAFAVNLTEEDIAYLEEPYLPQRIVGAIDQNPPDGVTLLDEKNSPDFQLCSNAVRLNIKTKSMTSLHGGKFTFPEI